MASYTKHLFLLTLLFLTISLQVNARVSQFFSKTSHPEEPSTNYNYNPNPNTNNDNNAALMDQSNSLPSSFTSSEFNENREQNVENNPSSFASEFPSRAFDENQEYYNNVKNNVPEGGRFDRNQQFGMSDTRFLENGRYFYDVNAERNHGQYEPMHGANYRNNGAYGYNSEMQGYQNNNQEDQKRQDEYYDP